MPAGMGFFEILGKVFLSMAIGYASNVITNALFGQKKAQDGRSPTYSFGPMATQTNSNMAIPIIYGRCKVAGNNLWQPDGESSKIYRLIGLGEGKVHSISDLKLNDVAIGSLSGCSYTAYLGDGTQNIDSRVPGATNAARAEVVGGMKYDAYLAITATASDQLTGNFNMTCVVEGREVRVYSNLTTYSIQYSRNPAWCILDFLTAYNCCGLSYSDIDLQSFLDAAAYCDEVVDGQARFTLNLVLDEKRSRLDWLAAMCLTCQAYPVYQNGKHGIKIEKYELPAAHFDIEPDESFEIWESKPEEIFDRVKVIYVDPAYESTRVGAQAEVTTSVLRDQINTRDLEVLGVDNFKQASRLAWFYANQANTCTTWAKYTTNRRALNRTIGDIITTTDPVWGITNQQWRIMEMVESQDGRVEMGLREYNPALYTDAQGSVAPTVLVSNLGNPFSVPPAVTGLSAERIVQLSADGLIVFLLALTWTALEYRWLSQYVVYASTDFGGSWQQVGAYNNPAAIINNVAPGRIMVKVFAQSKAGFVSLPSAITIDVEIPIPPSVASLSISLSGSDLIFTWPPVLSAGAPVQGYYIRRGDSYAAGQIAAAVTGSESSQAKLPALRGTHNYWVVAYNQYGVSPVPAGDSITITSIPKQNYVDERDNYEETGEVTGHGRRFSGLLVQGATLTYPDMAAQTWADLSAARWMEPSGPITVTGDPIDIGKPATVLVSVVEKWMRTPDTAALWECRVASTKDESDAWIWSGWSLVPLGEMFGRCYQFRLTVGGLQKCGILESASVIIDVPEKTIPIPSISVPLGGIDIVFSTPFVQRPIIWASPKDAVLTPKITALDGDPNYLTGCHLELWVNTTTEGSGTADLTATGF